MSLDNEMERICRIIASDRDLKVTVRGVDAYSVPGEVNLPSIENFDWLGEHAKRMLHGLADHESAHAKYTEHSQMAVARRVGGEALGVLVNAIEDGRIEKRIGLDYPGARQNLDQKNRWFWTGEKWQEQFAKSDLWSAFCRALTLYLRGTITIADVRAKREDVAKMLEEIPALLRKAGAVTSTRAAFGVAKSIYDHFGKEPEPPPPPMPPPPSPPEEDDEGSAEDGEETAEKTPGDGETDDESEETEEGDEDGEGSSGDADSDPDDEGEEEGDDSDSEGDESDEEEETPASSGASSEEPEEGDDDEKGAAEEDEEEGDGEGDEEEPHTHIKLDDWKVAEPIDPEAAIRRVIDEKIEDGEMPYLIFSHEFDFERDCYSDPIPALSASSRRTDTLASVLDDAHKSGDALASAFEAALRARRDKHPVAGADEGEVDEAMLAEFSVGAADADTIYREWVAEDDREVAVAILIDCSGSMNAKERLARRSAAAISLALTRCQIAHEVTGFTTLVSDRGMSGHPWTAGQEHKATANFAAMRAALQRAAENGRSPDTFAREVYGGSWPHSPLQVPAYAVFKPYDVDNLEGLLAARASCENLDGEAVLWQARRLARRPEPRRVMFVLSDGLPAGHRWTADGTGFLKETVERVINAGIEVYGIGMMSTAVEDFYPKHWVAHNMNDLTEIAFGSLIEVLTQARDERACVMI